MQTLCELAPEQFRNLDDREKSAGPSNTISLRVIKADSDRGRKVLSAAKDGHEAVYGTKEERDAAHKKLMDLCISIHQEHPGWLLGRIREETARRMGISPRTVERYTSDLKKQIAK